MVPGMTERGRLAADVQRLEWLADARISPGRLTALSIKPDGDKGSRPSFPLDLWRRGLSSALLLSRRLRLKQPRRVELRPRIVDSTAG